MFLATALYPIPRESDAVLSTPEQIAALTTDTHFLIGDIISPLSGQVCIRKTDLIARGAQNIELRRIYIAPFIPTFQDLDKKQQEFYLYDHLAFNYRGWVSFPHVYLRSEHDDKGNRRVRFKDPNGTTLEFKISKEKTTLTSTVGITNFPGDSPTGKHDPRNVVIEEKNKKIIVKTPSGSHFHYERSSEHKHLYLLQKEILPSGKVLRYAFKDLDLVSVKSYDPHEKHLYATLTLEDPNRLVTRFKTSSNQTATYNYQIRSHKGKAGNNYHSIDIPVLSSVDSPFHRTETFEYDKRFILESYQGKNHNFQTTCKDHQKHYRVKELQFSAPVHDISYDDGSTTVQHTDGTSTVYQFSKELLLTAIQYFDEQGKLRKQKKFHWTENQWLKNTTLEDEKGNRLYKREYAFDSFGNPILETFKGDLRGLGEHEAYSIEREFSKDGRNLLLSEQEGKKITSYKYLPKTNLITEKNIQEGNRVLLRETYSYDPSHNLILKTEDDGAERRITQYVLRQEAPFLHMPEQIKEQIIEKSAEKVLRTTHLFYDSYGNVTQEKIYDSDGVLAYTILKKYDKYGNLLSETNPLDQIATYTYDKQNRLIQSTPFSGNLQEDRKYDTKGRLVELREIGDQTHTTQYVYDLFDRLTHKTDPFGNTTVYTYDPVLNKISSTEKPPLSTPDNKPLPVITSSTYSPQGFEITSTDASGRTTTTRYNAYGSPAEIIYPDGGREIRTYQKNGWLKTSTDPDGLTITYSYDTFGRVKSKTFSSAGKTITKESFRYTPFHLLEETDREGYVTTYTYDPAGRKIREEREGRTTEWSYDSLGRVASVIKNHELVITYTRDLLGRILEETSSDAHDNLFHKISYTYDPSGNLHTITRYIHNKPATETFTYDSFDRRIEHIDALGHKTETTYIESHILVKKTTDPLGLSTYITYDSHGNKAKEEKFTAYHKPVSSHAYFYDPCNHLTLQKDHILEDGIETGHQITTFSHDFRGKLSELNRSNQRITKFTYTHGGKLSTKTLPDKTILSYDYTPLGHLYTLSSSDHTIDQTFKYNLLGHLLAAYDTVQKIYLERTTDPFGNTLEETTNGLTLQKTYDSFGRTLFITLPDQSSIQYTYDPYYLRSVERHPYIHTYDTYDLSGLLLTETLPLSIGSRSRTYDAKSQPLTVTSPHYNEKNTYDPRGNLIQRSPQKYTYDDLSQLTSSYTYDSLFNRTQKETIPYTLNKLNEILHYGSTECRYDPNGNLIRDGKTHYTFDPLNRLVTLENPTHKAHYIYDALGRRHSKKLLSHTHTGWQTAYTEHYLYDNEQELGSFTSTKPKALRIPGLPHQKTTQPIAIELDQPYVPTLDSQNNIHALLSLTSTHTHSFTPFGERLDSSPNPYSFASTRLDPEFNLLYFIHRHYSPSLGRWLSPDPLSFFPNPYHFLYNNPFRFTDPNGTVAFLIPVAIWGIELVLPSLTSVVCAALTSAIAYSGIKIAQHLNHTQDDYNHADDMAKYNKKFDEEFEEEQKKKAGSYAPARPLPRDKNGVPIPDADVPHTQLGTEEGRKGNYTQAREFDDKGNLVRDIDFTDHGRKDHPNPHQHRYLDNPTGGTPIRGDPEPLIPNPNP